MLYILNVFRVGKVAKVLHDQHFHKVGGQGSIFRLSIVIRLYVVKRWPMLIRVVWLSIGIARP